MCMRICICNYSLYNITVFGERVILIYMFVRLGNVCPAVVKRDNVVRTWLDLLLTKNKFSNLSIIF